MKRGATADSLSAEAVQPSAIAPGAPVMPPVVSRSRRMREAWNYLLPLLNGMGILKESDGAALAALCSSFAQFDEACAGIDRFGLFSIRGQSALRAKSDALRHMASQLARFGLDPRSRQSLTPGSDGENPGAGLPGKPPRQPTALEMVMRAKTVKDIICN